MSKSADDFNGRIGNELRDCVLHTLVLRYLITLEPRGKVGYSSDWMQVGDQNSNAVFPIAQGREAVRWGIAARLILAYNVVLDDCLPCLRSDAHRFQRDLASRSVEFARVLSLSKGWFVLFERFASEIEREKGVSCISNEKERFIDESKRASF